MDLTMATHTALDTIVDTAQDNGWTVTTGLHDVDLEGVGNVSATAVRGAFRIYVEFTTSGRIRFVDAYLSAGRDATHSLSYGTPGKLSSVVEWLTGPADDVEDKRAEIVEELRELRISTSIAVSMTERMTPEGVATAHAYIPTHRANRVERATAAARSDLAAANDLTADGRRISTAAELDATRAQLRHAEESLEFAYRALESAYRRAGLNPAECCVLTSHHDVPRSAPADVHAAAELWTVLSCVTEALGFAYRSAHVHTDSRVHPSGVVEVLDVVAYRTRRGLRVDVVTCGGCGRSWDDSVSTSVTPAPAARCVFEDARADAVRA